MNLKEYAAEIKRQDTKVVADKYLSTAPKGYICPECGNGTGNDGTGAEIYFNGYHNCHELKCHKCGKNFNNLTIIAHCEKLNLGDTKDFVAAVKIGCDLYGLRLDSHFSTTAPKSHYKGNQTARKIEEITPQISDKTTKKASEELPLIHADIKSAQANLEKFLETQGGNFRALICETLKHFGCGDSPKWISPKNRREFERGERDKLPPTSHRFIIPTANHYNAILLPADRTNENKKWWKMHAGTIEIFGADFLPVNADLILVVEGEIDAMSIWQATQGKYNVIATCGAGDGKKLLELLKSKYPAQKPKILILFDPDETGRKKAQERREELLRLEFPAVCKFLSDENSKLDANQILQEQGNEKLAEIISELVADAQEEFLAVEKEIAEIADFNKRADEWKKHNGAIDPATLEELRNAEKHFKSLSAEDITAEIILNSKRKIALCRVYDFCELSAKEFLGKIERAITTAENKVRAARKDNSLPPVSADIETLNQVSIRDLKDNINKIETQIKKAQKSFQQRYDAEIQKQQYEEYLEEQMETYAARAEKIQQLQQGPLTDETIAEIIENVANNLDWLVDKHGMRVRAKATAMNFKAIFCNDPNIKDLVAYDEFQQAIVFAKKPIWRKDSSCVGEMWQDSDDSELRIYLRETYQELAHEKMTYDYLTSYANKKSFHVVKDYFNDLPEWDGEKRAEEFFIKFLKVEDTPYTREVTRKFLLAAMARIYHPGCNFQSALVLQGAQSIGKSYVFERLGGKWHTTLSDNVDDPHAIDALQNSWIVEMKEFSAARKADVNALKSFIERSADNRRSAYERRAKISKRHCVFAITVNDEQFLRDQTGNRRFWILKCRSKMFEIVDGLTDEYIRQVWAEVKKLYDDTFADGFTDKKLQLSFDSKRRAEEIADGFMQDDGMKGEIEAFLQMKIPYQAIWKLFTKEQRRKFIADSYIKFEDCNLNALHNANSRISNEQEYKAALELIKQDKGGHEANLLGSKTYTFYGVELRQSICAAEILNECFGNGDRRKSSQKINEILPKIEGWQVGARQRNYSGYGDQKKIFYRIADAENEELQDAKQYEPNEEEHSNYYDDPRNDPNYTYEEDNDNTDVDDDDLPF